MAFTLAEIPGLIDLPDAAFTENAVLNTAHLREVNYNANGGTVNPEIFFGEYQDGDTVELPTSPATGYQYKRTELRYVWVVRYSANKDSGACSASGAILTQSAWVDPTTGEAHLSTVYYSSDQGGTVVTTDGLLAVFTIAVAGWPNQILALSPTFTDVADADLAQDKPAKETILRQLNANAKHAPIRLEFFTKSDMLGADGFPLSYKGGDTVALPVSPVDGYAYSRSELKYLPFLIWTGTNDRSAGLGNGQSGAGCVAFMGGSGYPTYGPISVNATTGVISLLVTYWDGHHETQTTDGLIGVLIIAQRAMPALASDPSFAEVNTLDLVPGAKLTNATLQKINANAKYAALRPEAFDSTRTNYQYVALPTSPVSAHAYARADCRYLYSLINTGQLYGGIRAFNFSVDQATGLAASQIDYETSGGGTRRTNNGTLQVITLGFRDGAPSWDPDDTVAAQAESGSAAVQDGNLLKNGGFDLWQSSANAAADNWAVVDKAGTSSSARAAGLIGDYAQRLTAATGAGHAVGVESSVVRTAAGIILAMRFLTRATVATSRGFFGRIYFYNSDFSKSCYIEPWSDIALTTAIVNRAELITVPANGATTVELSLSSATIVGTLDFDVSYVNVEFLLSNPSASTSVDVDWAYMRDVSELLTGNLDTIPDGEGRGARTPSQSQYTIQDAAGNPFNPLSATTSGTVSKIDCVPFFLLINGVVISVLTAAVQISSLTPGLKYYVYYDDAKLAGGAVTLLATTNQSLTQDAVGRICVGSVTTPLATGGGVTYRPTTYLEFGSALTFNPALAYDGSTGTCSEGNAYRDLDGPYTSVIYYSGFTNPTGTKSSVSLKINSTLSANNSKGGKLSYSLDGGSNWTDVYDQDTTRTNTTDTIALSAGQDWSLIKVYAETRAPASLGQGGLLVIYDIHVEGTLS